MRFAILKIVIIIFVMSPGAFCQVIPQAPEFEKSSFYLDLKLSSERDHWIRAASDGRLIGTARWDSLNGRYLLFSMDNRLAGIMEAVVGSSKGPRYTQFLYYDKDSNYKGIFIRTPGGRPHSMRNPYGELGGVLRFYRLGAVPPEPPLIRPEKVLDKLID
jgi:hypothetical protein